MALCVFQAPALASTHLVAAPDGRQELWRPTVHPQLPRPGGVIYMLHFISKCAPCAGLEKEMLVFTCSCFHLGKLRKRDSLWLIIFQVSACIKVRTLFTACGPYVLAGSWKDKVDTHQTLPPQHVPVCSVTQSCLWLFATPWTVAARVYPSNPLEWVAVFSSRGSSQPRDQTHLSLASPEIRRRIVHHECH